MFLHIKKVNGTYHTNGPLSGFIGHQINDIDGAFIEWNFNGQQLNIHNDRFGIQPLYYFLDKNEIAISTSITKLCSLPGAKEADNIGMSFYLRAGYHIGDRTPFHRIKALPAHVDFKWNGDLSIKSKLALPTKSIDIPRTKAVDEFNNLFARAIEKRIPTNDFAIPLSGGMDSRHILLELYQQDALPSFTFTAQKETFSTISSDVKIASLLSSTLGIPHKIVFPEHSPLASLIKNNECVDFCGTEHSWFYAPAQELNSFTTNTLFDGIGGDYLTAKFVNFDAKTIKAFCRNDCDTLLKILLPSSYEKRLEGIIGPTLYNVFNRERAEQGLMEVLSQFKDTPNPAISFFITNRVRRSINLIATKILSNKKVLMPFLDSSLFDFLIALPPQTTMGESLFTQGAFQAESINKRYSTYSNIPFEDTTTTNIDVNQTKAGISNLKIVSFLMSNSSPLVQKKYVIPRIVNEIRHPSADISRLSQSAVELTQLNKLGIYIN